MFRKLSIFCLFFFLNDVTSTDPKLNIEILYESLCPDSLRFINHQLYPVWKELEPYVNLKLVPFGKSASTDNGAKFICEHGPLECKGNRIQSCALDALENNQNAQIEYVNCFMKLFRKDARNQEQYGQACAENIGLDFNRISQCYGSEHGTKLQLIAENDTYKHTPSFVPTILFNGVFNQQLQDEGFRDFRQTVCQIVAKTYPEACQKTTILRL